MTGGDEASRILHAACERLGRGCGVPLQVLEDAGDHVVLQVGGDERAVMGLSVKDVSRPVFAVSYPKLVVRRNGERLVQNVTAEGVLVEGLEWIAKQLAAHGVVQPEVA